MLTDAKFWVGAVVGIVAWHVYANYKNKMQK
jgi:hypothetical protein